MKNCSSKQAEKHVFKIIRDLAELLLIMRVDENNDLGPFNFLDSDS